MGAYMRLSLIEQEYGGETPTSLSEYYLNNGYVNSANYIPEQGNKISFSHFTDELGIVIPRPHRCLTTNNGFNINLNEIADWHAEESNITPMIDSALPNFYKYVYDGNVNGNSVNYIYDGGHNNDMYDNGNYIDIDGNCITGFSNLSYGSIYTEPTHGFFVTPVNVWPNSTISYIQTGTVKINVHGEKGSDTGGTVTNDYVSYSTSNDRYGSIFYNANGDAGDPSILDVWFTVENSNWGSIITSSNDLRETEDRDDYNHSIEVGGSNYMFIKTLLSLSNGEMPPTQSIVDFVQAYVYNMPITITASNVNIDNRLPYDY